MNDNPAYYLRLPPRKLVCNCSTLSGLFKNGESSRAAFGYCDLGIQEAIGTLSIVYGDPLLRCPLRCLCAPVKNFRCVVLYRVLRREFFRAYVGRRGFFTCLVCKPASGRALYASTLVDGHGHARGNRRPLYYTAVAVVGELVFRCEASVARQIRGLLLQRILDPCGSAVGTRANASTAVGDSPPPRGDGVGCWEPSGPSDPDCGTWRGMSPSGIGRAIGVAPRPGHAGSHT